MHSVSKSNQASSRKVLAQIGEMFICWSSEDGIIHKIEMREYYDKILKNKNPMQPYTTIIAL